MQEKLAKLINVKSAVTLTLTGIFAYLAASGNISTEQYMNIYAVIIAFYFGTQSEKKNP